MDFEFIHHLVNSGIRVFNSEEALEIARQMGMSPSTLRGFLSRLVKKKMIERLKPGLYCLGADFLTNNPLHEYEIALALVSPSAIAYLSAISYHKLTDQISSIFYVITITEGQENRSSYTTYTIKGLKYRIIYVKKNHFFGIEKKWFYGFSMLITDLERTLLDGLMRPKYCGGFREVLYAFEQAIERIDIEKIISYAIKLNDTVCKRLGYILEKLHIDETRLQPLLLRKTSSYSKLDASGPRTGNWNNKWLIVENI